MKKNPLTYWLQFILMMLMGLAGMYICYLLTFVYALKYSGIFIFGQSSGGDHSIFTYLLMRLFQVMTFAYLPLTYLIFSLFGQLKLDPKKKKTKLLIFFAVLPFVIYFFAVSKLNIQRLF